MYKISYIDKFFITALVFLLSLAVGYYPIAAQVCSQQEDCNLTRATVWLSLK